MKFGKYIQRRQLEVPEYAASFVNYKALKKLVKRLSATPNLSAQNDTQEPGAPIDSEAALQANKAAFFFQVERELEKVNGFYLQKEAELKIRLKTLLDKKKVLQSRHERISRRSAKFTTLEEGFQQFSNDINKLQQFVETNGTAFSKILKKWDKTSKSKTKELYLSRAVEVQPFFNATVISELSDEATTCLQDLAALADGDHVTFEDTSPHVVSSKLGTEEEDADTLLLNTIITRNIDSLRHLLVRMKGGLENDQGGDTILNERFSRAFLASINQGQQEALQVLLKSNFVDIGSEDDINHRNCLHQATIYGNAFVLDVGLTHGVPANRADVYGRIPLHYASMHGRLDMLNALLKVDATTIHLKDHDNFTPLIHAIIHDHIHCVQALIDQGAIVNATFDTDHAPLNLACEHGSMEVVEILLKHGANIGPDAEGLYPQHLVARSGQSPQLLHLLHHFGANLNEVDKLYGWTPLIHAASEGNVPCLQELLQAGVDPNIFDEKGVRALYYAAWEGHVECMKLLTPFHRRPMPSPRPAGPVPPQLAPLESSTPAPMMLDGDSIPDLILPPPIIPIQRYGHNFLESKTVVQIRFEEDNGDPPLLFFHNSKYPAARLTVSSKVSGLIPKNIILPFQEDTREVTFQIDSLDSFTLDFDIFPTYGAKVIAKTVALPNTFKAVLSSSGHCCLPLFDPRLRPIGQISFRTQVIKPFPGQSLEITNFETYWKETSQLDANPSMFVTGSSLSGDFVQIFVQFTADGIPVLWPRWTVSLGEIDVPVSRLKYAQFQTVTAHNSSRKELQHVPTLSGDRIGEVHRVLATAGVSVQDGLALLPLGMNVNMQVIYPSQEEENIFSLGPTPDLNVAVDALLNVVFDHARQQRVVSPQNLRSVVFSSYNPVTCTALNWKQPNFPVFLCNDLGQQGEGVDERMTAVGQMGVGMGMMAPPNVIQSSGRSVMSTKKAVRLAQVNNLMGVICSFRLMDMIPALGESIKSHGLVLVVDKSAEQQSVEASPISAPLGPLPKGVDGILKRNGVLRFSDSIEV